MMSANNMDIVARNYSKALYAAAKQAGVHERVMSELDIVAEAFEEVKEAGYFFSNPLTPLELKRSVAEKILSQLNSPELKETLSLMITNGRLGHILNLREEYHHLLDQEKGILRGRVYSSVPLEENVKAKMTEKMTKHFGKQVLFDYVLDPRVLGGTRIELGGLTFDDSIQGHLYRMADDLNRSRV